MEGIANQLTIEGNGVAFVQAESISAFKGGDLSKRELVEEFRSLSRDMSLWIQSKYDK
jgi:hypothetical protein